MTGDGRPEDEQATRRPGETRDVSPGGETQGVEPTGAAPDDAAHPAPPRYRPPAPYPPPANAVPGYAPPTGRVWAPPAAPTPWPPPAVPPPLHSLRPDARPRWGWKQSLWGLLLGMGPFMALYAAAYSMSANADFSAEDVTVATGIIALISAAIGYGWQLFAAWLFSVRSAAHKLRAWGFRKPTAAFFWTIPVTLVAAYVASYVNDAVFSPPQQDIVDAFPPTAGGIVLFTIVAVLMAPLAEEVYFRGFVFKGFAESWGWVRGAAVSGALFSLAHLQLTLFLPLFALGFGLAWVYQRTGSLWTSIALHAIFNGVAVLAWALTS